MGTYLIQDLFQIHASVRGRVVMVHDDFKRAFGWSEGVLFTDMRITVYI